MDTINLKKVRYVLLFVFLLAIIVFGNMVLTSFYAIEWSKPSTITNIIFFIVAIVTWLGSIYLILLLFKWVFKKLFIIEDAKKPAPNEQN